MCKSYDVLQSSFLAAPEMTSRLCDYGNGSMGNGIRRLADEMTKDGYKSGVLHTSIVFSTVLFTVWGVKKLANNYQAQKNPKHIVAGITTPEQEEKCDAEI